MTTIEKIKNLTWWNEISKLKDILMSLFTNTENIDTRVTNIENNPPTPQILQGLKSVVDISGYAWKDNEYNYISILDGTAYDRRIGWDINNAEGSYSSLLFNSGNMLIDSTTLTNGMQIRSTSGVLSLKQHALDAFTATTFRIASPTVSTVVNIPAKTISGNYTINTTPDITYTVSTLPSGVLNDMAIVTDATAPTYLGTLVGGGAVVCPVWNNGTIWVSR